MKLKSAAVLLVGLLGFAGCTDLVAPDEVVAPRCSDPAPLFGEYDARAPGYIVVYHAGVDPMAETSRLADLHDFEPTHIYEFALRGFSAVLSPVTVAAIRCAPSVDFVEHDAVAMLG